MRENDILRVRRAALAAILSQGGIPRPAQFVRAGLPPLFRASEWMMAAAVHDGDLASVGVSPDQRTTPDGLRWNETQIRRCKQIDADRVKKEQAARLARAAAASGHVLRVKRVPVDAS